MEGGGERKSSDLANMTSEDGQREERADGPNGVT